MSDLIKERFYIPKSVGWRALDEHLIVVSMHGGSFFALKGTERLIWEGLTSDQNPAEIRDKILAQHDVSPELVESDLQRFLTQLLERKLIEKQG